MACYGLAPRALFLAIASWRQRVALQSVFVGMPGAADLRDRLDSNEIATAGAGGERAPHAIATRAHAPAPRPARVRAVRWSGLALEDAEVAALVRGALEPRAPIFVLPIAQGDAAALASGSDARIWSRALDAAGDPFLFVVTAEDVT
jgi:hypothetical protein